MKIMPDTWKTKMFLFKEVQPGFLYPDIQFFEISPDSIDLWNPSKGGKLRIDLC